MKKIKNRGMTLTELLVSIAMLSIALVSMYGLMSNLQKKKGEVDLRTDDLIKILDIEKNFQLTVMQHNYYGIDPVYECGTSKISEKKDNSVDIQYNLTENSFIGCNSYTLSVNNKVIEIKDNNTQDNNRKWTLKKSCEFFSSSEDNTNHIYYYVIKCTEGNVVDYIKFPMYFSNVQ